MQRRHVGHPENGDPKTQVRKPNLEDPAAAHKPRRASFEQMRKGRSCVRESVILRTWGAGVLRPYGKAGDEQRSTKKCHRTWRRLTNIW